MLDHYDQMCFDDYRTMKGLENLTAAQYARALARPGAMSPSALRKVMAADERDKHLTELRARRDIYMAAWTDKR